MSHSKMPTHCLRAKEREGKATSTLGVGWLNKDGSMSIQLNPCVVIDWKDNVHLTLFPFAARGLAIPSPSGDVAPGNDPPFGE